MKSRTAFGMTTAERAANAGIDLGEFRLLDDELHLDLLDEVHQVKAVVKGTSNEFPFYLLDCPARNVKVAVIANGRDMIAAGDLVLLPDGMEEQGEELFLLRLLVPVAERNANITAVAASMKPHLPSLVQFLTNAGFKDVTSAIEVEVEPDSSTVAAVASRLLSDGTLLKLTFDACFSNVAAGLRVPYCEGALTATRQRLPSGGHLSAQERLAFIEAFPACCGYVGLCTFDTVFESDDATPWVVSVDVPRAIAAVDVRRELVEFDLWELRLHELFE